MIATNPSGIEGTSTPRPAWLRLHIQVLAAILLGILVGWALPSFGAALKPLGDGFVKIIRMIIAPVIFLTIVTGIARLRDLSALGRIAGKAFLYFLVFSTLALVIGLVSANILQPGAALHIDPHALDPGKIAEFAQKAHERTVTGFLLAIIPDTLTSPLTGGDILQVLFVAILTGMGLSMIGEAGAPVLRLCESASLLVFRIVAILMLAAPLGTFGAMAFTVGQFGLSVLLSLAGLILAFFGTALFFILIVLGLVARLNGFSILRLIRYLRAELLLILGTSSSEAALPSLIAKLEAAGCAQTVVGIVVPTGYSFNLDGTNIYMTLAALFIAQAVGIHLPLGEQILLVFVAMLSSKGAAGVTGAGFITLAATLSIVPSVPVAGMALILGIDRFMSQGRSLTNFIGNAVATIVVARWENALDREALSAALAGRPAGGTP